MKNFANFVRDNENPDLAMAMLLIARDVYPALHVEEERVRWNTLSSKAAQWVEQSGAKTLEEKAKALAYYLYEIENYRGNETEYHDPRNSYIHEVIMRKKGIPISLSILYLEAARHANLLANGISFPGHFLVRVERPGGILILDPFHQGKVLHLPDLHHLLHATLGPNIKLSTQHLAIADNRTILTRVLQNLKVSNLHYGNAAQALIATDQLMALNPENLGALRDRGILQAQLGAPKGAVADLEAYLARAPEGSDKEQIENFVKKLRQAPATRLN